MDGAALSDALAMPTPDWIAFYGGGRHRAFVYEGEVYPQLAGQHFHSIAAFLRTVDRYDQRATIWSRLKMSWNMDDSLTVPVTSESKRKGLIYRLFRRKTSQVYVGLTLGTLDQRWVFHVRAAKAGATTKLAQAIREDGLDGFSRNVLEADISGLDVLASREIFWAQKLDSLGPQGLNTAKPGGLGGPRGKRVEVDGESYRSLVEAAQLLGERLDLPSYVVRSRIAKGLPIPKKARKHAQHEDAGTNLYRRWLALVRRHPTAVVARWKESYKTFKADVQPFDPARRLIRLSDKRPWGPKNFEWVDTRAAVERSHGTRISAFGVTYPSLRAVAQHFGLGVSTLKDRIGRQSLSIEAALKEPLSNTSYRRQSAPVVDGRSFRSKRQAILYLAESRGWTEDQAKYRFTVGKFN
jgi:hypothetical protein